MFQKCFCCLLPSCLPDVQPRTSLAPGFYTGTVHEVGPDMLLLSLFSSVTAEKEVIYIVPKRDYYTAEQGDVAFVLKMEESELVTVPAAMQEDEIQCTIVSISSNFVVLSNSSTGSRYVFPYTHFLKDPLKYIAKPACLARISDQNQYDVIIEEDRQQSKINASDSGGGNTEESGLKSPRPRRASLRPANSPLTSPSKFPGRFSQQAVDEAVEVVDRIESLGSEPLEGTGLQNISNPFVIKEEDQSSSFLTLQGDSGSGDIDVSPVPFAPNEVTDETSFQRLAGASKTSQRVMNRVLVSPYQPSEGRRSVAHPDLVGRDRVPLLLLKQPGVTDRQIEKIGECAVAWRSTEPDGGSFFRCVAIAWLEHLARVTTSIVEVDSCLSLLEQASSSSFQVREGYRSDYDLALRTIQSLRTNKDLNRMTAIVHLQSIFQQEEIMHALERYVRMLCANYMCRLVLTPDLGEQILDNIEKQMVEIDGDGMEFSGLTYTAVAESLSVCISVLTLGAEGTVSAEEFQPDEAERQPPTVHLLLQDNHFVLLYAREELAVDGYDLETHCFEVLECSVGDDQTAASIKT